MTKHSLDTLEEQLTAATRWDGPTPELWRRALDSDRRLRPFSSFLQNRIAVGAAACLLIVLSLAIAGTLIGPRGKSVMLSTPSRAMSPAPLAEGDVHGEVVAGLRLEKDLRGGFKATDAFDFDITPPATDRVVIRKATVELEASDVRACFSKAVLLVSEAGGEYVQESSLTGGATVGEVRQPFYGSLTLRVRVARISEVLNKLRDLGKVVGENSGGEDVTSQAVDLDARLRNEQRVETELLELMESRKDAPLKEILELREQIARVRENIERLTAQRDRLSHLASLATVLVIIREPAPGSDGVTPTDKMGDYFTHQMSEAWHDGLRGLTNSISWIVSVLVAGALWWILVAMIAVVLVRSLRRPAAPTLPPPPPSPPAGDTPRGA